MVAVRRGRSRSKPPYAHANAHTDDKQSERNHEAHLTADDEKAHDDENRDADSNQQQPQGSAVERRILEPRKQLAPSGFLNDRRSWRKLFQYCYCGAPTPVSVAFSDEPSGSVTEPPLADNDPSRAR